MKETGHKKDVILQGKEKKLMRDILYAIESILFLPCWYAQKWHKRDQNIWTFGAWSGLRYSDNSRALYEYMLANHPEIHCVWMTRSEDIYRKLQEENKPVALCSSKEGKRIQKHAGVFFMTCNLFDADARFMNGIRFINLWHGVPIKKIGEDAMGRLREHTLFKRFKTWFRRRCIPWEFLTVEVVSGSPFFEPFLRSAFALSSDKLIMLPEPRLDKLVSTGKEILIQQLDRRFNYPLKVLYMPTFRDDNLDAFNPFAEAGFDAETFVKMLDEKNVVLLYKGHFMDDTPISTDNYSRIMAITDADYDNMYVFIKDVDILITDYSSVYFDFLYLGKPMILFPFDYETYMQKSREFYFDYNLMGAKKVFTWKELEICLREGTYYRPSQEEVQRFRPLPIGHCCETIANYILQAK